MYLLGHALDVCVSRHSVLTCYFKIVKIKFRVWSTEQALNRYHALKFLDLGKIFEKICYLKSHVPLDGCVHAVPQGVLKSTLYSWDPALSIIVPQAGCSSFSPCCWLILGHWWQPLRLRFLGMHSHILSFKLPHILIGKQRLLCCFVWALVSTEWFCFLWNT